MTGETNYFDLKTKGIYFMYFFKTYAETKITGCTEEKKGDFSCPTLDICV